MKYPGLMWADLQNLLIKEFADEGTAIQVKDETRRELGARATKLSTIALPGEIRDNAAIQMQLPDLYVDASENERIRHDVIKEVPIRLSVIIDLAKDSENVWEKKINNGARFQGREELGSRKNRRKNPPPRGIRA